MRPMPHRTGTERRQPHGSVETIARVRGEDLDLDDDEVWIAIREF